MDNVVSKVFENEEFGKVQVVVLDSEPWFFGKDVASALGYSNPSDAISRLMKERNIKRLNRGDICESQISNFWTSDSDHRSKIFINESGLYKLIMRSNLKDAEKFQDWVTDEVLPTIRKTGGYVNNDELFIDTYLEGVSDEVKQLFRDHLAIIKEKNAKIKEMEPKAGYFDDLVDRKLHTNVRDTAKELGMKQKQFVKWLIDHEYVYRDAGKNLRPYSQYVGEDNLFVLKDAKSHFNDWAGIQMLVTVRGKETFRLLLQGFQSFSNNEEDDGQLTLDLE